MGVRDRKIQLPAPTESSTLHTSGEDPIATDLATDISRRTDRTSYSIPEDGSPVTITTSKRKDRKENEHGLTRIGHQSQTSLLIEYFEGGKGSSVQSRPSVRVRVTPSSRSKNKDAKDHVQITETAQGARRPSYTRRISLGPKTGDRAVESDEKSISSYASAAEDSNLGPRRPPVEIEVLNKDGSDLSANSVPGELRYQTQNISEISSMPPDSMIDGRGAPLTPRRNRSRSLGRDEVLIAKATLKTPTRRRSRSLSRERIAQKVMEKLSNKSRKSSGEKQRRSSKGSTRSESREKVIESLSSPRGSGKSRVVEDVPSGTESSLLTTSALSGSTGLSDRRRSGDQYSIRSGTSKASINNPKLLEMVEDSIRRLIKPEIDALRQEQKMSKERAKFESFTHDSTISEESGAPGALSRTLSKHSSAPDFSSKPKVVLNRDENDPGITLSGNSVKGRREHRRHEDHDSPLERIFSRGMSEETVIRDENGSPRRSGKSKSSSSRLRDAAAGAIAGGILTHAALQHHDSRSSIDKRERRRRRSKSHSRNGSIAESTEDVFQKHDVPPMPFQSEVNGSDLTRESILSNRTEQTSTPLSGHRGKEIREVNRGSPREVLSPQVTPTRSPRGLQNALGTNHTNLSRDNLNLLDRHHEVISNHDDHEEHDHHLEEAALAGAGVAAGAYGAHHLMHSGNGLGSPRREYQHGRGLSPIQSVASYREESEPPNRHSLQERYSTGSFSSAGRQHKRGSIASLKTTSSIAEATFDHSNRPKGINLEDPKLVVAQHELRGSPRSSRGDYTNDPEVNEWYDRQHEKNQRYRGMMADSVGQDSFVDSKRLTGYTDDSENGPYGDRVSEAQHIRGLGANPEFNHTPHEAESAVASLLDQSTMTRSSLSAPSKAGETSYLESPDQEQFEEYEHIHNFDDRRDRGSPLKNEINHHFEEDEERGYPEEQVHDRQLSAVNSPRQSIARSVNDEQDHVLMTHTAQPLADDPIPEIGHFRDSISDINTNPSDIQGPMPTTPHDEHWTIQGAATPQLGKGERTDERISNSNSAHGSLKTAAAAMLAAAGAAGAGAAMARDKQTRSQDSLAEYENDGRLAEREFVHEPVDNHGFVPRHEAYLSGATVPSPAAVPDEGHETAAHPLSPGQLTPTMQRKGLGSYDDDDDDDYEEADVANLLPGEDPLASKRHDRHLSGNSHGMDSPLYDSAMGRGKERIQSKDVVALMDHLTVRDAQRNARDTEILVTLVRSAVEMRNSFEDLKRFILEQDEVMMNDNSKQHERTVQKIIGGPRPQPQSTAKSTRHNLADDEAEDLPTKRRNVFRRALRGLGSRNSNDLGRIEDMLMQLLGDMDSLKAGQTVRPRDHLSRGESYQSYEDSQTNDFDQETRDGVTPTPNRPGYPRQVNTNRSFETSNRVSSQNRISTVLEGDEELDEQHQRVLDTQYSTPREKQILASPIRENQATTTSHQRGSSVPLNTPPQQTGSFAQGTQSNENTPRTTTDKSRKHKSTSSSFFPKISRWSKTTASSGPENNRLSNERPARGGPASEASRSGSDLGGVVPGGAPHYDPTGDDRLRSNTSLQRGETLPQQNYDEGVDDEFENRPPSPLVPSGVSENPTYHAHRNSLNLQHPQPRQGPTDRYQSHLENQAQSFSHDGRSPAPHTGSPDVSDQWGSNPILSRFNNMHGTSGGGGGGTGTGRRGSGGGNLSPISDSGYSDVSRISRKGVGSGAGAQQQAPPRPPKIRDEGPLIPVTAPVNGNGNLNGNGNGRGTFAERAGGAGPGLEGSGSRGSLGEANGSLTLPNQATTVQQQQQRKPSGPRPISLSGSWAPDASRGAGGIDALKMNRFRGSPNAIPHSSEEDVTF
ncbi:hypothetical protein MMC25_003702 [Agyrium rufum]|nr:hypothetical protein [Agyrium rufum]